MKKIILATLLSLNAITAFAQIADSTKRSVKLQGAANFRDLGGYKTKDGKSVKWGKLYRSADMSKLTDADLAELKRRNIKYDVDLRGTQEAQLAPDKMNPGTDYILCPAGSDSLNTMMKDVATIKTGGDSIMRMFYGNTQYLTARYKPFFNKLLSASADDALVFHCTAGKDRTGMGAALLLYSLGVPYETIVNDYLASNYYRREENKKSLEGMVNFMHINEGVAKDVLSVKKEYLDATFTSINKQYGSVDLFLKQQIGLTDLQVKNLKDKYLQ